MNIQNISSPELKNHFKFNDDKWYDFKYDNVKTKIITFKEDAYYSSTTLSATQYENRKDMIFISIIYSINNNSITITDILTTNGKDIKTSNDKVLYNSIINAPVIPDQPETNNDILSALRLVFTSNLSGDVQILNM
jgi:hypothetical protein